MGSSRRCSVNNINERVVQQARNEKKNVSELLLHTRCDVAYEKCKQSLTVYQQRKRLIELAVVYVHDFMDITITRYIDSYEDIRRDYGFVAGDHDEDARDDERIKDFIQHLKCVHGAVTDSLSETVTVERKLKEHTAKLLTNHGETQNNKRKHKECDK